jgi:hypothetical protein
MAELTSQGLGDNVMNKLAGPRKVVPYSTRDLGFLNGIITERSRGPYPHTDGHD